MKRTLIFARRVTLELLRDPLTSVFALGFPIVMLIVMTLVNQSIPDEAAMTIFSLPSLVPAVWVFGMTFLMLFSAQLLAKDRSEAFLIRLYL
ncbi:MAG: ABC transporter permease, partial [Clostridia bacterium]|nr:ABC transporter permease [Clostridia bacterium]